MPESKISLTVITPVFNGEKYIENCLKNVAEQAFEGLEHLVMDGGSSDGTVQIVQSYQDNFSHIRLISEKDRGQSDAMNKGIREAKGSIIGFLNVDDYYEPDVLRRIPALFSDLVEPSFISGNLNIWNSDGSFRHFNRPNRISFIEILSGIYEIPYNPSAYFYHKSLHEKAGFYDTEDHFAMDFEFIVRAASHISLVHIDEVWGNFCLVPESKTQNQFSMHKNPTAKRGEDVRNHYIRQLNPSDLQKLVQIKNAANPPVRQSKSIRDKIKYYLGKFRR